MQSYPNSKNLRVVETTNDEFQPRSNAPDLIDSVSLDFDTRDEKGRPATLEGLLKQSVLSADSSKTVTAAAGVMKSVYGVVGMAGVGRRKPAGPCV